MMSTAPITKLVLFMVCLAIAGSALAGAHYYTVDLPTQKNLQAPENAASSNLNCQICKNNCKIDLNYISCVSICNDLECSGMK